MKSQNDIIGFLPAAGSGGTTLDCSRELAGQLQCTLLELPNPSSSDELSSGRWAYEVQRMIRAHADPDVDGRLVLVGHCMGGLSAFALTSIVLATNSRARVGALLVNTPYPATDGRIPTMSALADSAIGDLLAAEGFPQELIDDVDMLKEIATGLRDEAAVADSVASWIHHRTDRLPLHALSTRGDPFIVPGDSEGWLHRSRGLFQWTICEGGHAITEATAPVLRRAIVSLFSGLE